MGQIRECTVCARRVYSIQLENWNCVLNDCPGIMHLLGYKDRPRNIFKLDGTKLGEFW